MKILDEPINEKNMVREPPILAKTSVFIFLLNIGMIAFLIHFFMKTPNLSDFLKMSAVTIIIFLLIGFFNMLIGFIVSLIVLIYNRFNLEKYHFLEKTAIWLNLFYIFGLGILKLF